MRAVKGVKGTTGRKKTPNKKSSSVKKGRKITATKKGSKKKTTRKTPVRKTTKKGSKKKTTRKPTKSKTTTKKSKKKGSKKPAKKKITRKPTKRKTTKKTSNTTRRSGLRRTAPSASVKWTTYRVQDNGNYPFEVKYSNSLKKFEIRAQTSFTPKTRNTEEHFKYDKLIKSGTFTKVFVGKDTISGKENDGNSMLFMLTPGLYMYVGWMIYEFSTKDEIKSFHSPVGNNSVPYPYSVGKENTILFLELVVVSNSEIQKGADPYGWYYGFDSKGNGTSHPPSKSNRNISPLKVKMISERL